MALTATQQRELVLIVIASARAFDSTMSVASEAKKPEHKKNSSAILPIDWKPIISAWQKAGDDLKRVNDPAGIMSAWLDELTETGVLSQEERKVIQDGGNIQP